MEAYFEQLKTRLSEPPFDASDDILELVKRVETGYDEAARKLFASDLELTTIKEQASDLATLEVELEGLRAKLEESNSQRVRYSEVMSSQQKEIDRLHEETRSLNNSLDSAVAAKNEALAKVCDVESNKFSLDCRINQVVIESDQFRQQLAWSNDQLQLKTLELETVRRNTSSEIAQLQSELASKLSEVDIAEQVRQANLKTQQDQQRLLAEITGKLQEAQVNYATMEQRYTSEIQASERRDRLYRDNAEDDQRQLSNLTTKLQELDAIVKQRDDRIFQLINDIDKVKEDASKVQAERDRKITDLEKELENANNLLQAAKRMGIPMSDSDVEPLSTAAVVAARLMKSGFSITQMYTKFLEVSDACQLKDVELKGLKEVLSKMHEELERKAPELKRQREELESAKREVLNLRDQLDVLTKERNRLQRVIRDRDEKMIQFERERSALRLKCGDLSKQIQKLLLRIEIAEGRRPADDEKIVTSSGEMETSFQSSGEFISQKLVEFKDIQELQQQNERLLALIRELSSDKEVEDERAKKLKNLEAEFERFKVEYEDLQTAHRHSQELLSAVTQQRDSMKLLTQSPAALSESTVAVAGSASNTSMQATAMSTPRPLAISRVNSTSSLMTSPNRKISHSNNERTIQRVEEELNVVKKRLAEREAELTSVQGDISALKIQLTEQKSYASSAESRLNLAEQRADSSRKEADAIREKSIRQDAICAQLEQTISSMRAEIDTSRHQAKLKDNDMSLLRSETDRLKSINAQISAERDALRRTEQHTNMLLTSMESIKKAISEESRDDRRRSLDRATELDREVVSLRIKLDEEKQRRADWIKQLELDLGAVQKQLAAEQEAHQRTQNALSAATSALAPDSDSAQADLERRQQAEHLAAANTELRLEVEEMRRQLTLLEEEKRQKESKQNELSQFSTSLESTLAEQKSLNENLSRSLRDAQSELEQKVAELEANRSQLEAARLAAESERDEALAKLESTQQTLQSQINELTNQVCELSAERNSLAEEKSQWGSVIEEAESKYDREVHQHAVSLEQLQQSRHKCTEIEQKVTNLEREKADMASRVSAADHRVTEMEAQEQAARSEADQYRQQLDALLEKVAVPGVGSNTPGHSLAGDAETSETVIDASSAELVKFLRRERSLLQSRLDVAEADVSRARTQISILQRELSDLRSTLNEERKQRQETSTQQQTAGESSRAMNDELQRRLESMNSLLDANVMLRTERDRFEVELKHLKNRPAGEDSVQQQQTKEKLATLQRQHDVIAAEKQAAQNEAERWRQRVQAMMEQMKRSEIDELRKAASERDVLRQTLNSRAERVRVLEGEISQFRGDLESARTEIQTLKSGSDLAKSDYDKLKSQFDKERDTGNQLRRIATKYKQQYLETDKLLKEKTGGVPLAASLPASSSTTQDAAKIQELESQVAALKSQLEDCQRKLTEAERERDESKKQLTDSAKKHADLTKLFSQSRAELRETGQRLKSLEGELEESKTARNDLERRLSDLQKQYSELHDLYEALERENRDLSNKMRDSLRAGSLTPGASTANSGGSATPAVTSSSSTAVAASQASIQQSVPPAASTVSAAIQPPSTAEFSPSLPENASAGPSGAVAVSPAAVVHPRLRPQPTASVAPTNFHAPSGRVAPPAPIPPIRVWPTVRQTTATSSGETSASTETNEPQESISPPPASSSEEPRPSSQKQKRSLQQSCLGQDVASTSTSDQSHPQQSSASETETDLTKRRRVQQQHSQSVIPFSASSEQVCEDDLLLESHSNPAPVTSSATAAEEVEAESVGEQHQEEFVAEGGGDSNQMESGQDGDATGTYEEQHHEETAEVHPMMEAEDNEEEEADDAEDEDAQDGQYADHQPAGEDDQQEMLEFGDQAGGSNSGEIENVLSSGEAGDSQPSTGHGEDEENIDDNEAVGEAEEHDHLEHATNPESATSNTSHQLNNDQNTSSTPWSFGSVNQGTSGTSTATTTASRPRIEPIIWESSPAPSATTTSTPGSSLSGRRLNVRGGLAPNVVFPPLLEPGSSLVRQPRPNHPTQRSRGFGSIPFPTRGTRGGPRRGV